MTRSPVTLCGQKGRTESLSSENAGPGAHGAKRALGTECPGVGALPEKMLLRTAAARTQG